MRCPLLHVSDGVRFGPGQRNSASLGVLCRLGILGRVGDRHRRALRFVPPSDCRRRLSVERQVQDLAERLAWILRRREALALAAAQEQRLAVRREGDDRSELPALPAGRIAPEHAKP